MIGVVLCGGQSTRMGTDKGLLTENTRGWAQIAAQKLANLQRPVVLSVNKSQLSSYSVSFDKNQFVIDNDALTVKGPLLGLLSVHQKFPAEDLFVLACDMKDMSQSLLQNLSLAFTNGDGEAALYTTNDKPEPLCAIYSSTGLKKIYEMMQTGELKKFSMMHVLQLMKTLYVPAAIEETAYFKNYNTPEDL